MLLLSRARSYQIDNQCDIAIMNLNFASSGPQKFVSCDAACCLTLSAFSPNQVLTHAARAAAKQLNKVPFQAPLVAAREGLWLASKSAFTQLMTFAY